MPRPGPINTANPLDLSHPLYRGLVSCWLPLRYGSGGTRLRDLCRRNHGTLTNDPTWGSGYKGFRGVYCYGVDEYVSAPVSSATVSSAFSIVVLCKSPVAAGTGGSHRYVLSYGGASDNIGIAWTHGNAAYDGSFFMKGSGGYPKCIWSAPPAANTWALVTADWDGSEMETFVNGVSQGTELNSTFGSVTTESFTFGSGVSGVQSLECTIGGVWLWNRRRLAGEQWSFYEHVRDKFPDAFNRNRRVVKPAAVVAGGKPMYAYQQQ